MRHIYNNKETTITEINPFITTNSGSSQIISYLPYSVITYQLVICCLVIFTTFPLNLILLMKKSRLIPAVLSLLLEISLTISPSRVRAAAGRTVAELGSRRFFFYYNTVGKLADVEGHRRSAYLDICIQLPARPELSVAGRIHHACPLRDRLRPSRPCLCWLTYTWRQPAGPESTKNSSLTVTSTDAVFR
jgi:hypothetical protein